MADHEKPSGYELIILTGLVLACVVGTAGTLGVLKVAPTMQPAQRSEAMMQHGMTHAGMQMSASEDAIAATTISKEKLANVPGKEITVQLVVFKPGAIVPEHHHAGSLTVYVLSGTIRSQLAGSPVMEYHAGDTFFEPIGATHLLAQNPSTTEEARILAIHVADEDAQLTVYH